MPKIELFDVSANQTRQLATAYMTCSTLKSTQKAVPYPSIRRVHNTMGQGMKGVWHSEDSAAAASYLAKGIYDRQYLLTDRESA